MADQKSPITYASSGIVYDAMDPLKKLAQQEAAETAKNLEPIAKEVSESRGDSAYVWEEEDAYRAFVIEGLGTKNLVADKVYALTGQSYYEVIAQDTVAAIVNDVIVVGAKPQVVNAYFGLGGADWLKDLKRSGDLVIGWSKACNLAGAAWGGGETPTHKDIINPQTIDLGGSAIGIIKPKTRLTLGDKLKAGDRILLIESNGIHANGLTLARTIADKLPQGFLTKINDSETFGEALLQPSHIYAKLVQDLFAENIDIHYMVNITGHGWRKLMRAKQNFSYVIDSVPEVSALFKFIQENSGNGDEEMYGNFNMGAGFGIFLSEADVYKAQDIAKKNGLQSWNAGIVQEGEKQVVIKPLGITFKAESLGVR